MSVNEINLPPSLIILKNSIIEGRVPKSNDLEVGEIALGLFGGKESIWSKNSEGNIVDLRSPRHDLFWSDLFIKYDTLAQFEKDLEKAYDAQVGKAAQKYKFPPVELLKDAQNIKKQDITKAPVFLQNKNKSQIRLNLRLCFLLCCSNLILNVRVISIRLKFN